MKEPRAVSVAALTLALALVPPSRLVAHDFWIEPATYHPSVGSVLKVRLRVGEDFKGDPVPRMPELIDRFVLASPAGEQAVAGVEGVDPAGFVRIAAPGLLVLGYRSRSSAVVLEPQKFEKYLADAGLERIIALRAERNERGKAGREVYSRCAKALVAVPGPRNAGRDRALGFTLELLADRDPYSLAGGDELPFLLLYRGRALEGALVTALSQVDPGRKTSARSKRDGRVVLRLGGPGPWLVKAVHMVPASSGADADWESLWASLTFDLPAAASR